MSRAEARSWAEEEFGEAKLGDVRRTARLVAMAGECSLSPSGRISGVFADDAARQGAYDFVESERSQGSALLGASQEACVRRCREYPYVFVPLDGTSLSLVDRSGAKGLGSLGPREKGGQGLKAITAIGVAPNGTPLGLLALRWWARGPKACRKARHRRPQDRETTHWLDGVRDVTAAVERGAGDKKAWFQVDREGDGLRLLR
jgi:hypothetical protein